MASPWRLGAQLGFYLAFAVLIGTLSSSPAYVHHDLDKALIRLSVSHAGERVAPCERLSPEAIAELAPNMRRPMDCPRERVPLLVELALDGEVLYRETVPPSGLARDGASTVYRRFAVSPGEHELTVRMRDGRDAEGFDHEATRRVVLEPRESFAIDFDSAGERFIFLAGRGAP